MTNLRHLVLLSGAMLWTMQTFAADIRPVGYSSGGCVTEGCCETGACNGRGRHGHGCRDCRNCNGRCGNGSAGWNNLCMNWCGMRCSQRCGVSQAWCHCCNTKAFPDSGWAPPAGNTMYRQGNWYNAYWPGQWYGNQGGGFTGGAPMVYQPTDTTQLGYSYGNVPTWRSNPGMIPPVPYPSNFHNRICPCDPKCGPCCNSGCMNQGSFCPSGDCYTMSAAVPTSQTFAQSAQPATTVTPPPVQTVAKVTSEPVATGPALANMPPANLPTTASFAQQPAPKQVQQTSGQKTAAPKNNRRPANGRTSAQNKSNSGWFGLPSLSEVSF